MDSKNLMDEKMQGLRAQYIVHLTERRRQLEKFQHMKVLDEKSREALISHAHKLAGSGKTYGYPEITTAAKILEKDLHSRENDCAHLLQNLIEKISDVQKGMPIVVDFDEGAIEGAHKQNNFPTLMIVDDDPDNCAIVERLFQNQANILKAHSAEIALEMLKNVTPRLLFIDNDMPGIKGLDLLDILKKNEDFKDIPVIMLTASHEPADVMRGMSSGAVDYVTKPFEPQKLLEKVAKRLKLGQVLVMIVDDDQPVLDILEYKFKLTGCKVVTAQTGSEALKVMAEQIPDFVILDRMMPGGDGMSVFLRMRGHSKLSNLPVVFLTAKRYENDILGALEVGVADYIVKPFNPDEVVARCLRLVNKNRL